MVESSVEQPVLLQLFSQSTAHHEVHRCHRSRSSPSCGRHTCCPRRSRRRRERRQLQHWTYPVLPADDLGKLEHLFIYEGVPLTPPCRAPPRRRTFLPGCSVSSSAPLRLFSALAAPQSVSSASAVAALATLTPSAARTTLL